MSEYVVRLSYDISAQEHSLLKAACAEAMIPMKDFLHDLVVRGIQELKEIIIDQYSKKKKAKLGEKPLFAEYVKDEA